jgi:hypothetical protein
LFRRPFLLRHKLPSQGWLRCSIPLPHAASQDPSRKLLAGRHLLFLRQRSPNLFDMWR